MSMHEIDTVFVYLSATEGIDTSLTQWSCQALIAMRAADAAWS